jgi:biofilm PGA synthesis lipoprotein PgaB
MEVAVLMLMVKRLIVTVFLFFLMSIPQAAVAQGMKAGEFLALCYHAVPVNPAPGDNYSISQKRFVEQMEYLRTHGYNPVSIKQILEARKGTAMLPEKPVLLTFDDGYVSYHDFVVPVLEELGYPSVLAVVGNFVDYAPEDIPEPILTWAQIKEVSSKKLVEVVSHSYDMHKSIQYTPQGNVAPYASVLTFDPKAKVYETEEAYRARLEKDFIAQKNIFREKLGTDPKVLVWPYGRFNQVGVEVAKKAGIESAFTLKAGYGSTKNLDAINRNLVENTPMVDFIRMVKNPLGATHRIRAMQVDLDLIVDPDSHDQTDENLGKLIDRLVEMRVNTVILQAFADPDGDGNIESVYFPNRVLPVRSDIFGWTAHQIMIRDMAVYAWMPTLSFVLPDKERNERLRVREIRDGKSVPGTSWYGRLTPFSNEVLDLVRTMYEDLASHAQISGVLFQDDAYLTDFEDFHPDAVRQYEERFGKGVIVTGLDEDSELAKNWARFKTEALIDFTNSLKQGIKKYRPKALFARNLYSSIVEKPETELWFAQNYELFLGNYDHVVVMAYPQMEEVRSPSKWLKNLVGTAKAFPQGLEKTVFKIQTYNWRKEEWINDGILLQELRDVLSSGGKHLAYYPDNVYEDKPALHTIKLEMSTKTYPFIP